MRRWIVGPEGRSRGRRRGLAARLMDVASYDEEGARALDAAVEAARALPSDGWLQRLVEGDAVRPGRGAARRGARHGLRAGQGAGGRLWAGDRAGRAGRRSGLGRRRGGGDCSKACTSRWRRSRGGSRRCSRMRRTGSIPRRARGSTARSAGLRGGAKRSPRGSPCSAGSAAKPTPSSSTGSRSSGSMVANMMSPSTAAGSTRPSRWPAVVMAPADGVLVTSATLARRRGLAGGRGAHRRAPSRRARSAISKRIARSITPPARKCWSSPTSSKATSPRWPGAMRD